MVHVVFQSRDSFFFFCIEISARVIFLIWRMKCCPFWWNISWRVGTGTLSPPAPQPGFWKFLGLHFAFRKDLHEYRRPLNHVSCYNFDAMPEELNSCLHQFYGETGVFVHCFASSRRTCRWHYVRISLLFLFLLTQRSPSRFSAFMNEGQEGR